MQIDIIFLVLSRVFRESRRRFRPFHRVFFGGEGQQSCCKRDTYYIYVRWSLYPCSHKFKVNLINIFVSIFITKLKKVGKGKAKAQGQAHAQAQDKAKAKAQAQGMGKGKTKAKNDKSKGLGHFQDQGAVLIG